MHKRDPSPEVHEAYEEGKDSSNLNALENSSLDPLSAGLDNLKLREEVFMEDDRQKEIRAMKPEELHHAIKGLRGCLDDIYDTYQSQTLLRHALSIYN